MLYLFAHVCVSVSECVCVHMCVCVCVWIDPFHYDVISLPWQSASGHHYDLLKFRQPFNVF